MKLNFWGALIIVLVVLVALGKIGWGWLLVAAWPLVLAVVVLSGFWIFLVMAIITVIVLAVLSQ